MHAPAVAIGAVWQKGVLRVVVNPVDADIETTITGHDEIRIAQLQLTREGIDLFSEILVDSFLERVQTRLFVVIADVGLGG